MLYVLWDESHIWGLLAVHAVHSLGIPYCVVRGAEIAAGLLQRERPAMLFVPGGNARHKADALGAAGCKAIRDYVHFGGQYLGFCGGAGLALTWKGGLNLCPWTRAGYDDRLQHFMSGHLHISLPESGFTQAHLIPPNFSNDSLLPVWWPGRFDACANLGSIAILASYEKPGADFWLADLPIASLPPDTFAMWHDLYGVSLSPTFLKGQPCMIHGAYGAGGYILSYSHLETPQSPEANRWLAHLLEILGGMKPERNIVPPWNLRLPAFCWEDADLMGLQESFRSLLDIGLEHGLLFQRNDWLMGWRTGIPGANFNNLWAALVAILSQPPAPEALDYWKRHRAAVLQAAPLLHAGGSAYLLAERLALTLAKSLPDAVSPALLKHQRTALFGPPMQAGGLYRDIMLHLDTLAYLQQQRL